MKKNSNQELSKEDTQDIQAKYSCGSCKKKIVLNSKNNIKCPECGYRIIFKERTENAIQYSTN